MTGLTDPPAWEGPSGDPNDEQFGDVVEPTTLEAAESFAAAFVGEPYDGAVIGRRGARKGPAALRAELERAKTHHLRAGPVGEGGRVGDLGDVDVSAGDSARVADVQATVRSVAAAVHDAGAFPVFLGGDNSLTYPNAAPLLDRGSLGVVSLDAHLDCREVRGDPTSGTPYRQLHEAGLDAFAVLGARDFETSTAYVDYVRDRGGLIVEAADAGADPDAAAADALDAMGDVDRVYVSVDADVLDAAHAPGVSAPTPGGLTPRELFAIVRALVADPCVAGLEVVEVAPPLDEGDRTVRAAARAVAHGLAGLRERDGDAPSGGTRA